MGPFDDICDPEKEAAANKAVAAFLSPEEKERFDRLNEAVIEPWTDDDKQFMIDADNRAVRAHLGAADLKKTGNISNCTCNAGYAEHRSFCPRYGNAPSVLDLLKAELGF